MHAINFLADAYSNGQSAGTAFRWVALLVVAAFLARRLVRKSWGKGFRRSPAGTVLGLVVVTVGLTASAIAATGPDPRLKTYKRNVVAGCVAEGVAASICACIADDTIKQMDGDVERLAALDASAIQSGSNPAAPPELLSALRTCAGRAAPAPA
jgi:hypothetical protein